MDLILIGANYRLLYLLFFVSQKADFLAEKREKI